MASIDRLRVGIAGCGLAASNLHLPALRLIPEVDVVAVTDVDGNRAESTAKRFDVPSYYGDLLEMLGKEDLDVVHVLTPPETHEAVACAAMDAGSHVLIEKPFAYTLEEVDSVIEKAQQTGQRFSVVQNTLFHPAVSALNERVRRGEVGEICSVQFLSGRRDQLFVPSNWYFKNHGGRLGETLPHAIYLLVELLSDLQVVAANARRLGHSITPEGMQDAETDRDELQVLLNANGGDAVASIYYSMNSQLPTMLLVTGTKGNLVANLRAGVRLNRSGTDGLASLGRPSKTLIEKISGKLGLSAGKQSKSTHFRQIKEFSQCLRSGEDFTVTHHKAREGVRVWCDVVEAAFGEPEAHNP